VERQAGEAAHGCRPVELVAAAGRAAIDPGAREIGFDAEHELARLHVVADLATGQPTVTLVTARTHDVLPVDVGPAVADMTSDIKPGPGERPLVDRRRCVLEAAAGRGQAAEVGGGGGLTQTQAGDAGQHDRAQFFQWDPLVLRCVPKRRWSRYGSADRCGGSLAGDWRRPRERCNDAALRSLGCCEACNCSFPVKPHAWCVLAGGECACACDLSVASA